MVVASALKLRQVLVTRIKARPVEEGAQCFLKLYHVEISLFIQKGMKK